MHVPLSEQEGVISILTPRVKFLSIGYMVRLMMAFFSHNFSDPGVVSSIPVRSHTFVEIDHEMISTVILLPSADSFKKGCCQLQAKVCAQITG